MNAVATSALISLGVSLLAVTLFWGMFREPSYYGVCEHYGWRLEGSGVYQHKHCYDPKTHLLYLPPEINP